MKTNTIITLGACQFLTGTALALTPFSDNFNATALNTSRWTLENYAKGKLTQGAGKVNFTVAATPTGDDFSTLELKNNRPGYNESWEVILDVANTSGQGYKVGTGVLIFNADDYGDQVGLEFNGKGRGAGFVTIGITNDKDNPQQDIRVNPNVTKGSLRVTFNKTSKLFTFWYDSTGSADGLVWTQLATFSPTGKGGDRRGNWQMNSGGGRFGIQLYGFAENRSIAAGKVGFDNFKLKALR
jgi:hypothetical protein